MWFDLTLEARDGSRHHVSYNPHTSECEGLPLPVEPGIFAPVPRVAKDKPLGKSRAPRVLKIQLGLSCNYACSYCSQAFQIADATVSRLADVEHFLIELDGWITGAPETIELWGGVNQTGFTGEPKAQKVQHDQRKPREPFFYRGTGARGALGSGERGGLQIAVAGGRLHRREVRMQ